MPNVKMVQEVLAKNVIREIEEFGEKYGYENFPSQDLEFSLGVKIKNRVDFKGGRTKFMKTFEKEVKMLYEKDIIGFREFGFLSLLGIYFVSYEDNTLRNKDGSLCTQKDIIEKLNITKPTASALIKKMVSRSLIFEQEHDEILNAKMYVLNPLVFYKGRLMNRRKKEKFSEIEKVIYENWKIEDIDKFPIELRNKINEAITAICEISDFEEDKEDS